MSCWVGLFHMTTDSSLGTLSNSSPVNDHFDMVGQTVQVAFSPWAERIHHTWPCSGPLNTSAAHKGLPVEQPTADESASTMEIIQDDYGPPFYV